MNRNIIQHGFILILLSLISGLFIPTMTIPRLGLSAHTIGALSGTLLIVLGSIWNVFTLSPQQSKLLYFSWLYSSYVNWGACLMGAIFGAGKATPIAASGLEGSAPIEMLVGMLLITVALVSFIAIGLSLYGLKRES